MYFADGISCISQDTIMKHTQMSLHLAYQVTDSPRAYCNPDTVSSCSALPFCAGHLWHHCEVQLEDDDELLESLVVVS